MLITRRNTLRLGAAAAGSLALPRLSLAQGNRPSITIAVQKIVNSNTLDVLREQSNVGERVFFGSIWESLIGRNLRDQLEAQPMLATEWKRIDDQTVELKLREGVRFHNGDEMTAEDVAFTFSRERMFGNTEPKNRSTIKAFETIPTPRPGKELPPEVPAVARRAWPDLARVDIIDKYTVRFINATPDVTLEGRLLRYGSDIMSRRGWEESASYLEWARKPVTTGPYKVERFTPDTELLLVSHDDYWGGLPPLQSIRFVEVPEVASRVNGLLSGEYDFACDIPPDLIGEIESNASFEVQGGTILNHRLTVFDKNHAQLVDPRVRRALTHSIDRQAIVDSLWAGRTVVPAGLQWPYYDDMFHADWTVPEFNPELAASLLKEAGYKGDPIPYRLLNNYYTNQVATAQILVEMWKAVGLNVQIESKENWAQIMERGETRAIRDWSNSAPFNDPVSSIVNQHGPNGQQQQIGEWTNAEMNELCLFLETSMDRPARRKAFRRMLEICEREDPAFTVLHQNATFTAKSKAIKWQASPAFAMDFGPGNFAV
ncbi:ABC transporter substrate-binding protein [Lutimaribacter sp. EGI FJ00015]|uniref:ABC transporter substrate-binding protein n=1 Tax=Lutimaribacter degradans TaxID=2945989 RepID=A0ACC5ZVS6_9RHOB|nr:ABC transporter substrate-binding protein [Lutimaribacter sp. EGI FJ00013]MCM2562300.1 ABC transporter substrate-binding protein [Lutimaribacter sp. EGI FJ00013]MCO0613455.1 ABC transporter substrate-binding protein [Lutimaribacter sp. EGI FJ00015]MCO0636429.1 ABC transporter substrate-binding protein [Lutimaribacter sp. EGI FJ00014]